MKKSTEEKLEQKLKTLAGEAKPSKNFEKALLTKVKSQFKATHNHSFWQSLSNFKVQFAGTVTILALAITTNYAYQNDSVVPGKMLYPVKRGAEKVESIFIPEGLPKSDYYLDMAERRTEELKYIKEDAKFEETANETRELLNLAKEELPGSNSAPAMMMEMDSEASLADSDDEDDYADEADYAEEEDEASSGTEESDSATNSQSEEETLEDRIQNAEEDLQEAEAEREAENSTNSPTTDSPAPAAQ